MGIVNTELPYLDSFVYFYIKGVPILVILDRIMSIMEVEKISQKQLTDYLGLQNTAFTKWKAGSNNSYIKHLPEIAELLHVSVDYLLGNTDIKNKPATDNGNGLSESEAQLIKLFNSVPEESRALVVGMIEAALKSHGLLK